MKNIINIGDSLTCNETGETFIAARDGCTFNYALTPTGAVLSDAGANRVELRAMQNREKPIFCYVSGDKKHVTGFKGNVLGTILNYGESRNGWHGATIANFRVLDAHGNYWSGRGAGAGMCCTLRAMKAPRK